MEQLKIGYFADGVWGHNAFHLLNADPNITIAFICIRYDSKDTTLMDYAKRYGIDLLFHKNINTEEFIVKLESYKCDLFVSMSFNQIFKTKVINLPVFKTINCHAGKLPYYRGRNILNWVLINDEKEFGITVHYVDEGIDTGDIILQETYPITDFDNYGTLLETAHKECARLLYRAVLKIASGTVIRTPQNQISPLGMYCSKRIPGDEFLNWNITSRELFNLIRSVTHPGPGAKSFLNGQEMIIWKSEELRGSPVYKDIPGSIIGRESNNNFYVKSKDSYIKVVDYEYGGKIRVGDRFNVSQNYS